MGVPHRDPWLGYEPGDVLKDLTDTYESVQRADYDIFKPLEHLTEAQVNDLVIAETGVYADWIRAGVTAAKAEAG